MKEIITVLRLIIAPKSTWNTIFKRQEPINLVERNLFYPLIGILAVSSFMIIVYEDISLSAIIREAIINFITYFIGYIICAFCLSLLLPKIQEENKSASDQKIKTLILYNMSFVVIINIIQNMLPTEMILLSFLPLYMLFMLSNCTEIFSIKKDLTPYFTFGAFIIIFIIPLLLNSFLNYVMPQL